MFARCEPVLDRFGSDSVHSCNLDKSKYQDSHLRLAPTIELASLHQAPRATGCRPWLTAPVLDQLAAAPAATSIRSAIHSSKTAQFSSCGLQRCGPAAEADLPAVDASRLVTGRSARRSRDGQPLTVQPVTWLKVQQVRVSTKSWWARGFCGGHGSSR
jgi:hypothetical protein